MEAAVSPDPAALATVFCALASRGPAAFARRADSPPVAPGTDPAVAAFVMDPRRRADVSRRVGNELSRRLAADPVAVPAARFADLLAIDSVHGFTVLGHLAAASRGAAVLAVADRLARVAATEGQALAAHRADHPSRVAWSLQRLQCLLSALSVLDLADADRPFVFANVADALEDSDALEALAHTPLFPAEPRQCAVALAHGGEATCRAILAGATVRTNGWAILSGACALLTRAGPAGGHPELARLLEVLGGLPGGLQPAVGALRASVLRALHVPAAA